ncbi:cytochrome c oxidase subunit 6A1, mitochondrial, partial [Octodon degus]|uniref:Cytochrome c oxidase subunit 6A1, mitochondrial n=1 Tax=Octodon degus TaxID=10160 RepID=A0A6P6EWK5_OCTDE
MVAAAVAVSRLSRLLGRSRPQVGRPMSSGAHGGEGSARMWKALTFFVALPGVGVSMLNVFLKSHHGEEERPEFIAY